MCTRGNDKTCAAFTLLEVIIATAIIALLTMSLYGFINTIRALMGIEQPTHFVVTFDVSGSTSRQEAFPEYKAHRPKMDEDLASQLPWIDKACEVLRLPVVT